MPAGIFFAGFGRIVILYVLLCHAALSVHIEPAVRAVQSEQAWCRGLPYSVIRDLSHEGVKEWVC